MIYGLGLLSETLPRADLTVNTVISPEASLATLWSWAKTLPVGIWIAIPVGARSQRVAESDLKRRQFDLECMVDEIATAYEAGLETVEYQPLTKVVRKLATPAPACDIAAPEQALSACERMGRSILVCVSWASTRT